MADLISEVGPVTSINPWDYPLVWRAIVLEGILSPGVCVDCVGSNPRKWDKRDGTGITGATLVFNGSGLAEFPVKLQLGWEGPTLPSRQQQWNEWIEFARLLLPPTTKNPKAMSIYHPNLEVLPEPIHAVVVVGNGPKGPTQVADGVFEWEIPFQQFRAPKPASAKPKGASSAKTSSDPVDQMINGLTDQVNKLAA